MQRYTVEIEKEEKKKAREGNDRNWTMLHVSTGQPTSRKHVNRKAGMTDEYTIIIDH